MNLNRIVVQTMLIADGRDSSSNCMDLKDIWRQFVTLEMRREHKYPEKSM